VKSGKMKISFGTDVEKKNRRANPAVRDAMAQLADASAEFQTAVQHSQVILEAGTNATACAEIASRQFPKPGKNAAGRSAAQKNLTPAAHGGERPGHLPCGLPGLKSRSFRRAITQASSAVKRDGTLGATRSVRRTQSRAKLHQALIELAGPRT